MSEPEALLARCTYAASQWPSSLRAALAAYRVLLLTGAVSIAAGLALLTPGTSSAPLDVARLLPLLGLALLAEAGELELFKSSSFSVTAAPIVAAILLLGVPGAAIVTTSSVLLQGVWRRSRWYKVGFNVAAHVLAVAAATRAAEFAQVPANASDVLLLLLPSGLAGLTFYLVNTGLTAVAIAVELHASPAGVWVGNFRWLWLQYLVLSLMGLLLAVADRDYGVVGVAAFALPPLMMRYVAKRYFTQEHVHQLQALNATLATEIRRREEADRILEHQALHDALTGLPNRKLLADRAQLALAARPREETPLVLMLMDLDRFKQVNDTFGHHAGDLLLQEVSRRLQAALRESDTVARLGGDEFAVLLPRTDAAGAVATARQLVRALDAPFLIESRALQVGASVGIAVAPGHGTDPATLLRRADVAMYAAKRAKLGHAVYVPELDHNSADRLTLASELRRAIERDELVLHYQPKLDLATGSVTGAEALVRWQHPRRGLLPPAEFIEMAEETELIRPLCLWVLDVALRECARWQRTGRPMSVAVNLSMLNLRDEHLPDIIAERLHTWGVRPEALVLEMTESALMADPEQALSIVHRLSQLGVHLAIDDFGTGNSSLGYLARLPVSELKIDRSFVSHMTSGRNEATIVRSTINLAHDLGLKVVAEGIEDRATWDLLAGMGCDIGQGNYISPPQPAGGLARWLVAASLSDGLLMAA
jgi:diguanylate cyclase (GGDEF)-like protein